MKIVSAEFVKSAFSRKDFPRHRRPEIAFLGRSNVGKSSLINSLFHNNKKLARISNTPGRTQSINFYLVNSAFYFADLPGYGFARVPAAIRESWKKLAEDYLAKRNELVLSIQLVDSRHSPTELDFKLFEWLSHEGIPKIIVATKADKLSASKLKNRKIEFESLFPGTRVIDYSSLTGKGREMVLTEIGKVVGK
jgi:GTP-binding protein